ncbi:hypothetical protein [Virgibacillus sp. DJP39]|uniref:hypothetical protein n=1 Tax=Virgibacillus sp. DJP39 TaxID=3409790 RepID=UPI003BB60B17
MKNRLARYFFHNYLPNEVMYGIIDKLLPPCINTENEDLDIDELVQWGIEIINRELANKRSV